MSATARKQQAAVKSNRDGNPPRASHCQHRVLDLAADPTVMTPEQRLTAFAELVARAILRRVGRNRTNPS
jgi:hypothetical protein